MSFVRSVQEAHSTFFDHVSFYKGQLFDRPLNYLIDQCSKLCSLFPCCLLVLLVPPINACCVCMTLRRVFKEQATEIDRNWQRNLIDNFFAGYARVPLQFSPAASPPNNQSLFIGFLHYKDFQWSWRWLMRRCSSTAVRRFRLVNSHIAALIADTTKTIKLGLNHSINSPLFGMNRYELWCCWIPFNQSSPWPIVISSNLQWPWN
jgi:hypothetical protein